MLEVGATGVGLIEETYVPDVPAARGGEKGYFAFGGSTVMCFFEPGQNTPGSRPAGKDGGRHGVVCPSGRYDGRLCGVAAVREGVRP